MPWVRIKDGLAHRNESGILAGGDVAEVSEDELKSFGDKFDVLDGSPASMDVSATLGAVKLAKKHGVSLALSNVQGTGKGGRITKADVEALLDGNA